MIINITFSALIRIKIFLTLLTNYILLIHYNKLTNYNDIHISMHK